MYTVQWVLTKCTKCQLIGLIKNARIEFNWSARSLDQPEAITIITVAAPKFHGSFWWIWWIRQATSEKYLVCNGKMIEIPFPNSFMN